MRSGKFSASPGAPFRIWRIMEPFTRPLSAASFFTTTMRSPNYSRAINNRSDDLNCHTELVEVWLTKSLLVLSCWGTASPDYFGKASHHQISKSSNHRIMFSPYRGRSHTKKQNTKKPRTNTAGTKPCNKNIFQHFLSLKIPRLISGRGGKLWTI